MRLFLLSLLIFSPSLARAECFLPRASAAFEANVSKSKALIRPTLERDVDACLNRGKDDAKKLFAATHESLTNMGTIVSAGIRAYNKDLEAAQKQLRESAKGGTDQARARASVTEMRERITASAELLKSVIGKMRAQLAAHTKVLRENDPNLTKYGFVLSDKKQGSAYAYPSCNSETNDNPAQQWSDFKASFFALDGDLSRLQAAVDCQLNETGAKLQ